MEEDAEEEAGLITDSSLTLSFSGDSFLNATSEKFSTFDRDNDDRRNENCAEEYHSGWWLSACGFSNLNGIYKQHDEQGWDGVVWDSWRGRASLSMVEMKIRPVKN